MNALIDKHSNDQLCLRTDCLIKVYKSRRLVRHERTKNLVVTEGRNVVRDLILNVGPAPSTIALGTGSSPTTAGMSVLGTEVFRKLFTRKIASSGKATYQLLVATTEANGNSISEAAIFAGFGYNNQTIGSGGQMLCRTTFAPIVKDNTIQITFTWDVTITSA